MSFSFKERNELLAFANDLERWAGPDVFVGLSTKDLFSREEVTDHIRAIVAANAFADGRRVDVADLSPDFTERNVDEIIKSFTPANSDMFGTLTMTGKDGRTMQLVSGTRFAGHQPSSIFSKTEMGRHVLASGVGRATAYSALLASKKDKEDAVAITASTIFAVMYMTAQNPEEAERFCSYYILTTQLGGQVTPQNMMVARAARTLLHLIDSDGQLSGLKGLLKTPDQLIRAAYAITLQAPRVLAGQMHTSRVTGKKRYLATNRAALTELKKQLCTIDGTVTIDDLEPPLPAPYHGPLDKLADWMKRCPKP